MIRLLLSRRQWIALATLGGSAPSLSRVFGSQPSDVIEARVSRLIREYEAQGYYRSATSVDAASGPTHSQRSA